MEQTGGSGKMKQAASRVAIVSIHGVGDHLPNDMAKAVAKLLTSRAGNLYSAFTETTICAKVEPVRVVEDVRKDSYTWGPIDAYRLDEHAHSAGQPGIDHVFMKGQLTGYKASGAEDTWEFLRMEGQRSADGGKPAKSIHVYDMFWSDLSGIGQSGLSILGGLYQLLFHLGSVGVNNVAAAAAFPELRKIPKVAARWDSFTWWQRLTASMLALPIGLLNLMLAAFAAVLFLAASMSKLEEPCLGIVTFVLFVLSLGVCSWVVGKYEKLRPGSILTYWCLVAAVLILSLVSVCLHSPIAGKYPSLTWLIRVGEVGFWMLILAWFLFWFAMIGACWAGKIAVKAVAEDPSIHTEADRASRTNWTARLSIALSAAIFLMVTFGAWTGYLYTGSKVLPKSSQLGAGASYIAADFYCESDTLCYSPLPLAGRTGEPRIAALWIDDSFWDAGLGFMPMLLLLSLVTILITLVAVGPSVFAEVLSPPLDADKGKAVWLGRWLDGGFSAMRWAGRLLYLGVLLFPIFMAIGLLSVGFQDQYPAVGEWLKWYRGAIVPSARVLSALIGGSSVGVLAFSGRLSKLALGLRTAVQVGLDVDNWLREHPKGTNPTVRICARYASLLRQIFRWKNERGEGYEALIIFAHSQGTIITADLLRFLHVDENNPDLLPPANMKVYLLTMGCPLVQLYGLRFPYLYGYGHANGASGPDPSSLGVEKWINAYRTGDYVGRALSDNRDKYVPLPAAPKAGTFVEFAIGQGAHTHYWDKTAEVIGQELDVLIAGL